MNRGPQIEGPFCDPPRSIQLKCKFFLGRNRRPPLPYKVVIFALPLPRRSLTTVYDRNQNFIKKCIQYLLKK